MAAHQERLGHSSSPVNPDEAIARGAAIYGAYLLKKGSNSFHPNGCRRLKIQDVTPTPCDGDWIKYLANSPKLILDVYEGDNTNYKQKS